MSRYKDLVKRRRQKQIIITVVFLLVIAGGWIYPAIGYLVPLCMLLGIFLGIFKGRIWCNYYCPRGSFFDVAGKPLSPQKKIPVFLRSFWFRVVILVLMMLMMSLQISKRVPDFKNIGTFFVTLLTAVTLVGIVLSLIIHQRTWCSFCPVGSLSNWFCIKEPFLKIDSTKCVQCKLCAKVCPIQLKPYRFASEGINEVLEKDCLRCSLCVEVCPKDALIKN
ncbi:4Fe-4S binding protein [bacterium]|nr:4Fe-4S binding protein [bacterium]